MIDVPRIGLAILFFASGVAGRGWSQDSINWTPPTQPVYAVFPNHSGEGSGPLSTKFGDLLMVQIHPAILPASETESRVESRALYEKGRQFALYVDGQRHGDVRIEMAKEHQCNSAAALVVPIPASVSKKVTGLATNAPEARPRSGHRRDPTPAERTIAVQAATREFLRNNVSRSLMTRIQLDHLTAVEVGNGEAPTVVGSFFIRTSTERHDLFLILQVAPGASIQYSRYGQTTDLADFKDHESISFVDHLDVNGDGTDEIVLEINGYEAEKYEMYARQREKWYRVAIGGEVGC